MKKYIKTALIIFILFLFHAFAEWDINPGDWGTFSRISFCAISACIIAFILIHESIHDSDTDND